MGVQHMRPLSWELLNLNILHQEDDMDTPTHIFDQTSTV